MKKSLLCAVLSLAFILCGCGENSSELPEDTPYNHGENAIMETEKGYYTNTSSPDGGHMIRFYERDTENQIFLCAKPECMHDGNESCAATYKNLECINSLLYDGAIYTLAIEDGDVISYSLYKAALDGTSFTKVGDAFSVSNSAGESYEAMGGMYFMIHKGYAYIPYHLNLGESTFGFAGSGLVKMDIITGKTETLASGENYFSAYPHGTAVGSGDYVYYNLNGVRNDDPDTGTYRHNIKTGETEKLTDYAWGITVGEKYFYAVGVREDDSNCIMKLDKNEDFLSGNGIDIGGSFEYYPKIFAYKDKVIAVSDMEGVIMILDENKGETGKISFDPNEISGYDGELINEFYISNDKLYGYIFPYGGFDKDFSKKIYSIPLADIEAGKDEWKFEYGIKNPWQLYSETGRDVNNIWGRMDGNLSTE